jgi:mannan endo-1,4-beta-mannosidase
VTHDAFIQTDGTAFVCDGEPMYFNGTNNFWLTDPESADATIVESRLQLYEELGLNLVRTWAYGEGQTSQCVQPAPGEYSEAAFEHLDYLIAKADEHGIRLVLALTDYWDHYGGIPKYAEWAGLDEKDEFYDDERAQQLYRDYVEYVLTRENTVTGREYRNEPAILAWELANEPRCCNRVNNVAVLQQWIEETAAYIAGIDDNHLVSTGIEGFDNRADSSDEFANGTHGTDFVANHEVEDIDICSAHLYPHNWGVSVERANEYLEYRARVAREEIGKPFHLAEFNWTVDARLDDTSISPTAKRAEVLSGWYDILAEYDAGAATIWMLVHQQQSDHNGNSVWPTDDSTMAVLDEYTEQLRYTGGRKQ